MNNNTTDPRWDQYAGDSRWQRIDELRQQIAAASEAKNKLLETVISRGRRAVMTDEESQQVTDFQRVIDSSFEEADKLLGDIRRTFV